MSFGATSSSTMQQPFHFFLLSFITTLIYSLFLRTGALFNFPSANISTKWINNLESIGYSNSITYTVTNVTIRYILIRETYGQTGPEIGCGFICTIASVSDDGSCESFLFSIFLGGNDSDAQIVWSANRDRPVRENATLEFSKNGDLVLRDFDGTTVWSTNTSGKSVVGMKLNKAASLVLFDNKKNTIWSSMDYPTDSLFLGQTLRQGQRLTANVSFTNSSQGPVYLSVVRNGILGFVGSQLYYNNTRPTEWTKKPANITFNNESLHIFAGAKNWSVKVFSQTNSPQFMRLDYGCHLRLYAWRDDSSWSLLDDDVLGVDVYVDACDYPTACGEYGICYETGCKCPDSTHFTLINDPPTICKPSTTISCKSSITQQLLPLPNMAYFGLDYAYANGFDTEYPHLNYIMPNSTEEACTQACLANCSCKAAFFQYDPDASNGYCYLPPELYSLKKIVPKFYGYNSSAFIKVQSFPSTNSTFSTVNANVSKGKKVSTGIIVAASVGALLACFLVALCVIALVMRRCSYRKDADDDEFNMLPGLPTRFAFEDIRVATNNFLRILGKGGFGSVFEGTLVDGTKIAVKRLDGVEQGKKEFLAEVETIGSIHYFNLVRLVGFCAEKSHRLLIYEYMLNGSLDKWIFHNDHDTILDWQTRRKIITDIAKGLTYLHEGCRKKIIHLDIKPQNILLDENFNAKVSDFGLAKLIDRNQIEVMTIMRGTPGYLAPEWLTSVITEKVDVFSFGVVVLEIICGRRNVDNSKDEEDFHLIGILQRKVTENKLVDMIDCRCANMHIHIKDVIMIMHLAMWCLQSDSKKRPLMSVVLKVLEGSMVVEADLDYDFSSLTPYVSRRANIVESVQQIPSILSGPR